MQQNNPMMMNNYYGFTPGYGYYQAYPDPYNMHPNQYPRTNPRQNKHQNNNHHNNSSNDRNQQQQPSNATASGSKTEETVTNTNTNTNASASSNTIGGYKDVLQKGYSAAAASNEKGKPNGATSSIETVNKTAVVAPTTSTTNEVVNTSAVAPGSKAVDTTVPSAVAGTTKEESGKKNVSIDPAVTSNNTNEENKWRRTTLSVESTTAGSTPTTPAANSWNRGERLAVTATSLLERNDGIIRYDKMALVALYTKGKECPPEIRKDYPQHSLEERAPCVAKNLKIPYNSHKKKGDDEPHPDEVLIFSQENLTKEAAFHYDANRLNGDVNDPEVIIRKV
jgi:hypothetical protein